MASHLEYDPTCSRITPVPSQILTVYNNTKPLNITLDSGATVSFIRLSTAIEHEFPIQPNSQLALLADEKTRLAALGEIDVTLTRANFSVRLRALVVKNLQAECFGGTSFHKDNDIEPRITTGQIKVHNKYQVLQTNPILPLPTALNSINFQPSCPQTSTTQPNLTPPQDGHAAPPTPLSICRTTSILPGSSLSIPIPNSIAHLTKISIQPSCHLPTAIQPQICSITDRQASIQNSSSTIILLPKKTQLLATPTTEAHLSTLSTPTPHQAQAPPDQPTQLPTLSINNSVLTPSQTHRLQSIHKQNIQAFNNDLTSGYNHKSGKYYANLRFKEDSKPEAKSLDVPQYNRQCASLQQALMDRLERQNVLVNPHDHGIEVKNVSPSWVIQKGSAKNKALKDCTVDEIRWVVAFNTLNAHLLPKPAKVSSLTKAVKFLARWKFHILADLHNSYFQIHIAKKHWCWLGVMTPFRGLRVLTRLGQGLLNSEGELDELLAIVLGDLLTEGICEIARDDIQVGGNTYDEAISNWERVLSALNANGLKLSPKKVRIFPASTEVYGVKLQNGFISPSDHVLSTLGITTIDQLKSVKDINAWRGLYKTLLQNLPKLASYMHPFDLATANKSSRDKFEWTPDLVASFNAAQNHLKQSRSLALPGPHEQLVLQPDGAQRPPAIGWVLSVIRTIDGKSQLVPVQYCSAKLKPHMQFWSPCELEAVATFVAVEQCSPWIMEATNPTYVCPDSKAVVQAANRMSQGKMSTNPRLQNLLACINRRPVIFHHSSAKLGQHVLSDTCSRTPATCTVQDCAIERFLDDLPLKIELMASSMINPSASGLFMQDIDNAVIAASSQDLLAHLSSPTSALPLGSPDTWRAIQEGDPDAAIVLHCKKTGDSPRKKNTNPTINRFFAASQVKNGILVVPHFDPKLMRHVDKIVVPPTYMPTLLTVIHLKCNHPSKYQMEQIFQRYFFAPPGLESKLATLYEQCYTCQSVAKLKPVSNPAPPSSPAHPGTHMQADIIRRNRQLILVNTDLFSNYATTCFIHSEQKQDLMNGLIQITTPIRRSETITIRTDRAPALVSLAKSPPPELRQVGISIVLPDNHFNVNSNAKVDKIIQELQLEIKKICPDQNMLSSADLARATSILNNRIRKAGLTAGEIQFARDFADGSNLPIRDRALQAKNISDRPRPHPPPPNQPPPPPGNLVLVKSTSSKLIPADPFIVTNPGPYSSTLHKIIHSHPNSSLPAKISGRPVIVKNTDLQLLQPLIPPVTPPSHCHKEAPFSLPLTKPPSKTTSHWDPLQGLPTDSDSESDQDTAEDDLSDPAWERPATPERPITPPLPERPATPERPITPPPPPPPQLLTPPAQIQRNLVRASRLLATSTPPDQPIIPLVSQLFAVHAALARQSLPVERSTPPPLPPPLPPHPPPPEGLPQRKAKLQAQSRLTSKPSHKIPQLEGAEPTPETTPDTSLLSPSKPSPPGNANPSDSFSIHPLSPLLPWSPTRSNMSLEWDFQDEDTPSFLQEPQPSPTVIPVPKSGHAFSPTVRRRRHTFNGTCNSQICWLNRIPLDHAIWNTY